MSMKSKKASEGFPSLGEAIRSLRQKKRISLRGLAEQVGVSAPFLSDVERNRRSTDKLEAIAKILEVPIEELARLDGRISADLKEWLAERPDLVALLKELQASGKPVPLESIRALLKQE